MKSSIIALAALLVAATAAQPHRHQHRHAAKHQVKRDDVVWVTDYVDIVETVLLTATVWVDENGNTIAPVETGTTTARSEPSTVVNPGIFNEPAPSSVASVVTSSTAAAVAPTVEAAAAPAPAAAVVSSAEPVVEPTPTPASSTTTIQVASVEPTPTPAAAVAAAPVVEAAQPTTAAVSSAPASASSSTGSSTGECSSGTPCSGDITYYEAGLGACGLTNNGETDAVVALPHEFMGAQSNGNPYCGKTITISKGGKTIQATVMDKCMGCVGRDLDLSNKAFSDLGVAFDVGRTTADWWFN